MQPLDAYKRAKVGTSDSVKVVTLLFDGAANFLRIARRDLERGDIAGKGLYLGKATSIVGELSNSLNMEQGGEIARNLRRLYDFILDRLLKANLNNDAAAIGEAERVLDILRSAWKEMEKGLAPAISAPRSPAAGDTRVSA